MKPRVPTLSAPKHVTMTDRVALARTQLVWPTVERGHPDELALDVLAAVLGQLDKENRLYRPLMYDKQLAANAGAFHSVSDLSGSFVVMITARPGNDLDDQEAFARWARDGRPGNFAEWRIYGPAGKSPPLWERSYLAVAVKEGWRFRHERFAGSTIRLRDGSPLQLAPRTRRFHGSSRRGPDPTSRTSWDCDGR